METIEQTSRSKRASAPRDTPASLFARNGKLLVELLELTTGSALASTLDAPPSGSIAVLSRNGARAVATVRDADDGAFMLAFDRPLSAWEFAMIGAQLIC